MSDLLKKKNNEQLVKKILILLFFFLVSFIYIFLFLKTKQLYVADDRIFHLERLEEAYEDMKSGHLFPAYVSTYSFLRIGQAINSFYPSFILCLYAILRIIVKSPILSLYLLIFLEQFLGLIIAFYAGMKIFDGIERRAFVFAIVFRLSSYVCYNDFMRMDIGESWALVFLPLTFCGLYLITVKNEYINGILNMTIGLTLQTYCHILTPVTTVVMLFIFYLVSLSIQKEKRKVILAVLLAALIYFITCLAIFVPILHMSKAGIVTPSISQLSNYSLTFSKLISYSLSNSTQWGDHNIGLVLVLTLLLGIVSYRGQKSLTKSYFLLGWLFTILSTNLFPWKLLSGTPVDMLQFPWRLLIFGTLFLSLYLTSVFECNFNSRYSYLVVALLSLTLVLGAQSQLKITENSQYHVASSISDKENPWGTFINSQNYTSVLSKNRSQSYSARFADYVPQKSKKDLNSIYEHYVVIGDKKFKLNRNKIKSGYQSATFTLNQGQIKKGMQIELPFLIYNENDYKLYVNGKRTKIKVNQSSCVQFRAMQNSNVIKAKIEFITPHLFIVARTISLVSLLTLFAFGVIARYKKGIKVDNF
jgi:hypothetical protein